MIPVEEHLARCLGGVDVVAAREVPLAEAMECLLAEDVAASVDLPSFPNSAMDGYAVVVADVASASEEAPVALPVAADVPAGPSEPIRLRPGTAVRVMTGAPVPEGTGAIVPVEWTDGGTDRVVVRQAPADGAYLRPPGEDVRAGEVVLRAGTRLAARHVGLLAAVGRAVVRVHPRPRVVVVSTGSELVPAGQSLGYGQIYDSNGPALLAAATALGADARYLGFVGDDEAAVAAHLEAATADADLVITSGGVSAGAYDPVKAVLRRSGAVWFGPVAMQPGMPQGFGHLGPERVPVLTLPGNPVSSMVSFEVFARPVIRALGGHGVLGRPAVRARAAQGWDSPPAKRQFVRGVLGAAEDGGRQVRPVGTQKSHLVADLAEADCLAVVPEDVTRVEAGTELECLLLEGVQR